ncbi:MAG: Trm112 family protein [Dysosmobacter sp.]
MAAQVTNYQCPSCTGPLHFVGASGKLECDYCGATYDVAEIEALYAEKEEKAAAAQQSAEEKRQRNGRLPRKAAGRCRTSAPTGAPRETA